MSQQQWMQRLARVLRRHPWTVAVARSAWRITRPKFSMGVVGVVFNESGQVLLVEHVFHPYVPWGLPGGWVDRGEDPAQALSRELMEELSLRVEIDVVLAVENVFGNHVDVAYACRPLSEVGALSYELLGYRWVDPDHLPHTHAFHRAAIRRARQSLLVESQG